MKTPHPHLFPRCPACKSNAQVTVSPVDSYSRGVFFCPCAKFDKTMDGGFFTPEEMKGEPREEVLRCLDEAAANLERRELLKSNDPLTLNLVTLGILADTVRGRKMGAADDVAETVQWAIAQLTPKTVASTEDQFNPSADGLTLLGNAKTEYPTHPDFAKLECIPNAFAGRGDYHVHLKCPEFTAVCPKTGQPDFAEIVIDYTPDELLIESKALKIYLFAFRQVGMFHEFVINKIAHDLFDAMKPKSITVTGHFMPRGGISIHPTVTVTEKAFHGEDLRFGGKPTVRTPEVPRSIREQE